VTDEAADRAEARVGEVLNDKWTLERLLGVGGMGAVYAGVHRNGARAAVKVLHSFLARNEDLRGRFLREGYVANRVDHPGVVKVLDDDVIASGPDEGTAYLVMELLVGEPLEARVMRGEPVTERDFLVVADAVLEVLDVAHRSGVVHRDIKPDNIFLSRDDSGATRIKVLDFGLAKVREGQSTTVHGIALGTPSFMSPEQASGRNDEIDGRTDLFALAATGFRLVTGRKIHDGDNPVVVVMKMGELPAPRIRTIAPHVAAPFARVIDRALEFQREDRYQDAAAMRADVQRALAELGDAASPLGGAVGPAERSVELSATDLEVIAPSPEGAVAPPPRSSAEATLRLAPPGAADGARAPGTREATVRMTKEERSTPAPEPRREATLRIVRDDSTVDIPMSRVSLRPAAVTLAIMCVGVAAVSFAGSLSGTAPEPTAQSAAPVTTSPPPVDARSSAVEPSDAAGVVAKPADTPHVKHAPPTVPPLSKPTKPPSHPRH
jgi:eukaryotic-like serine/threonine-protein kinase